MRHCTLGIVVIVTAWLPGLALAHPTVDEGVRHYEQAAFEDALGAFGRAEHADDLSRSDVVQLLLVRAQVHFAMENEPGMLEDLRRLAAVDPTFSMGREIPPQVREAFERETQSGVGVLALVLETSTMPSGVSITARVSGDPGGLVRSVRIRGRAPGGEWVHGEDQLAVPAASGAAVEYWGEIVGLGGAVLARQGNENDPLRHGAAVSDGGSAIDDDDGFPVAAVLIAAGAVAAVAAVVIVVLATSATESDDTQFGPPMIMR